MPVAEPTYWVSAVVTTPKKNRSLRVCIDPRPLNHGLKRERYQLPVLEDVLPDLSKAKIFSSFDLRSGYCHVKLDTEGNYLTMADIDGHVYPLAYVCHQKAFK